MLTVDELKAEFLAVLDGGDPSDDLLTDDAGNALVPDAFITRAIASQTARVERTLDVRLKPIRYAARPQVGRDPLAPGLDYDVEVDALPWLTRQSSLLTGKITLHHRPVQSVQRIRAVFGSTVLYDVPIEWATLHRRHGTIEFVPDGQGSIETTEQMVNAAAMVADYLDEYGLRHRSRIPSFWAVDYTAGLPDLPDDVRAWIGWNAAAEVLTVAAVKANKPGVTSQSETKDGVTRSQSINEGPGGRYGRLLQSPVIAPWLEPGRLDEYRRWVRPEAVVL